MIVPPAVRRLGRRVPGRSRTAVVAGRTQGWAALSALRWTPERVAGKVLTTTRRQDDATAGSHRVKDAVRWKSVFDVEAAAGAAPGLRVKQLWRSVGAADEVFFLLDVEDPAARPAREPTRPAPDAVPA